MPLAPSARINERLSPAARPHIAAVARPAFCVFCNAAACRGYADGLPRPPRPLLSHSVCKSLPSSPGHECRHLPLHPCDLLGCEALKDRALTLMPAARTPCAPGLRARESRAGAGGTVLLHAHLEAGSSALW